MPCLFIRLRSVLGLMLKSWAAPSGSWILPSAFPKPGGYAGWSSHPTTGAARPNFDLGQSHRKPPGEEAFVRQTWLSPAEAREADLAEFLRPIVGKGAAKGTFKSARYGLQFLFQNTLGRDWGLFKKNSGFPVKSDSPRP
jgi:hypothetical protein